MSRNISRHVTRKLLLECLKARLFTFDDAPDRAIGLVADPAPDAASQRQHLRVRPEPDALDAAAEHELEAGEWHAVRMVAARRAGAKRGNAEGGGREAAAGTGR